MSTQVHKGQFRTIFKAVGTFTILTWIAEFLREPESDPKRAKLAEQIAKSIERVRDE